MTPNNSPPPAAEGRPANALLRILRGFEYGLIAPHLQSWQGSEGQWLYEPGDDVEMVYFPCGHSLVSFLVTHEDGRNVETLLVGSEGAIGGIVSLGRLPAYCGISVRHSGPFVRLRVAQLEEAKSRSPALRALFARYADCLMAQVFQSTACNAVHSIEQRLAKWLIGAMDRTREEVVPMTHEQLALTLGVGRSYASRIMRTFKEEGILETRRGSVVVRDVALLHERACRCNDSVRSHYELVLRDVYGADGGREHRPA